MTQSCKLRMVLLYSFVDYHHVGISGVELDGVDNIVKNGMEFYLMAPSAVAVPACSMARSLQFVVLVILVKGYHHI